MARKRKRSYGGRTGSGDAYNAVGTPAMARAKATTSSGFASGGATTGRKRGGMIEGSPSEERADKRARGGSIPGRAHGGAVRGLKSSGGSPFSSARSLTGASGKSGAGMEGSEEAPGEP
jgi:hypothetical protein